MGIKGWNLSNINRIYYLLKVVSMKKLYFLLAALSLFYFGCSDVATNNVNQPVNSGKQLVQLPAKSSLGTESPMSVSDNVNGALGDLLLMGGSYTDTKGNKIIAGASLLIPPGAFKGKKTINMSCADPYAGLDFSPSMNFDKSLYLTLSFTGLDLKSMGITNSNVGFYYVDPSGNLTPIPNLGVSVNLRTGTLTVVGAKIDHFSRYAFAH
jgi:hypothetical protein